MVHILRPLRGNGGPRGASFTPIMKSFHRILLAFAFSLSAIVSAPAAEESLYDTTQARKLTPEEQRQFGPQSGKYRYDARMIRAAKIAAARARPHSTSRCWRFVKTALLAVKAVDSYPKTAYAKEAAVELPRDFGFKKLSIRDPYDAPVGAVLVYGGRDAGHVELRTPTGFVSDFASDKPYHSRPLIGVFVKPEA